MTEALEASQDGEQSVTIHLFSSHHHRVTRLSWVLAVRPGNACSIIQGRLLCDPPMPKEQKSPIAVI